jgi:hypothetical protein
MLVDRYRPSVVVVAGDVLFWGEVVVVGELVADQTYFLASFAAREPQQIPWLPARPPATDLNLEGNWKLF